MFSGLTKRSNNHEIICALIFSWLYNFTWNESIKYYLLDVDENSHCCMELCSFLFMTRQAKLQENDTKNIENKMQWKSKKRVNSFMTIIIRIISCTSPSIIQWKILVVKCRTMKTRNAIKMLPNKSAISREKFLEIFYWNIRR